jgi:nuclear pore complex protein Nup107
MYNTSYKSARFDVIIFVSDESQINLIALYTSKLPTSLQVSTYASFLKEIGGNSDREKCLLLAEKARLDVPQITKRVVEIIRQGSPEEVPSQEISLHSNAITLEDSTKIRAIEWLCFDPSQRAEALYQSNALARVFLAFHKLEAANKLFDEILPQDSVAVVLEKSSTQNPVVRIYFMVSN